MRIIVVDDEPIIRQGIVHKIRQTGLPVTLVGEAGDGIAGLELVRSVVPDIVVTDIQMPEMNGLEFIQRVIELAPQTDFIILSGYDDFDYAKQAMRHGVTNYLLKPLDDDELYESLAGLIESREAKNNQAKMYSELRSFEQTSRETVRQQALTQYLQDDEAAIPDDHLKALADVCTLFTAAVLRLEPFSLPHLSFAAQEEELLWFAVKNIVTERFESGGMKGVLVQHSLHRYELVYVLGIKPDQDRSSVLVVLEEISYGIRKYLKLGLTIGIGSFVDGLHRIQECYREAKLLTRNAVLHGSNRIYQSSGAITQAVNRKSIIGNEDGKMLTDWLKRWETDKIHRWVDRRLGAIVQDPNSVYVQAEWFCVDLFLLFNKYLLDNARDSEWTIGEMDDLLHWLQQVNEWHEISERMNRLASNIVGLLTKTDELAGKEFVEAVRLYIDSHYAEQLSLQSIADRFYIHPNYFSKRFKEKYGESFIDYLTSVRMKKAASLLRDTELKVSQIGERVGFEDAAYFGSVFRKYYGETPTQFRARSTS